MGVSPGGRRGVGFQRQRAARRRSGAALRSEPADIWAARGPAGGQRHLGLWEAGPRRLARQTVRLADIPTIEFRSPLGWASPSLRTWAPRGRGDQGVEDGA